MSDYSSAVQSSYIVCDHARGPPRLSPILWEKNNNRCSIIFAKNSFVRMGAFLELLWLPVLLRNAN